MVEALKIFLVEDEFRIAKFLSMELEHEGFTVVVEQDGCAAYERMLAERFDVVLLDWMLPGMEGVDICRKVREVSNVPIIMLTAKGDVKERVMGLNAGADDYLTKPFAVEELLARIQAVLRRHKRIAAAGAPVLSVGDVVIIPENYEVRLNGEVVNVPMKEYQLLELLMKSKRKVVKRREIIEKIWGYGNAGDSNVVDVAIRNLRQKLEENNGNKKFLYTIRGIGYVVKD